MGLTVKRQTGSHIILTKPGLKRPVVVARHGRELKPGTVRDIVREAEIDLREFLKQL
jgi:predicted RNA binding protein YcfA (HicA-like mRNA interferase family)